MNVLILGSNSNVSFEIVVHKIEKILNLPVVRTKVGLLDLLEIEQFDDRVVFELDLLLADAQLFLKCSLVVKALSDYCELLLVVGLLREYLRVLAINSMRSILQGDHVFAVPFLLAPR